MASVPDSGSSGLGLSPGWGHCVVFMEKTLYSHSRDLMLGTSILSRGVEIFQLLHATETGISYGLMGHLACVQTLLIFTYVPFKEVHFILWSFEQVLENFPWILYGLFFPLVKLTWDGIGVHVNQMNLSKNLIIKLIKTFLPISFMYSVCQMYILNFINLHLYNAMFCMIV